MWFVLYDVRHIFRLIPVAPYISVTKTDFRYGYDAGVLGGLLTHPAFLAAIGNPTGNWTIPMVSSSYTLAACVTSLFATGFAFHIGRRGCIILGCIGAVVGAVIQASSHGVPQIIVGRLATVQS